MPNLIDEGSFSPTNAEPAIPLSPNRYTVSYSRPSFRRYENRENDSWRHHVRLINWQLAINHYKQVIWHSFGDRGEFLKNVEPQLHSSAYQARQRVEYIEKSFKIYLAKKFSDKKTHSSDLIDSLIYYSAIDNIQQLSIKRIFKSSGSCCSDKQIAHYESISKYASPNVQFDQVEQAVNGRFEIDRPISR